MEIALDPSMQTYSGGLGILAGDTLRSAADLAVPMAAVTLVHRKGYFRQRLNGAGDQAEEPAVWTPEDRLRLMEPVVSVQLEGREVRVRAWCFTIDGIGGHTVPVYLLDTALNQNSPWDQSLTDYLYGGDEHYRLCQELVLGVAGIEILARLGHTNIEGYHMNEGHSALLALALLERRLNGRSSSATEEDMDAVKGKCIFTTHTPVPAGHDQFPRDLIARVLGEERTKTLDVTGCLPDGALNMTYLALRSSRYINGVAMHHGEVSRGMFPRYPIRAITNGVHAVTWTSAPLQTLYDRHIPEWRHDNAYLRYALGIPLEEIREAHAQAKRELLTEVERVSGNRLDESVMTIGFARRASTYKRADLLFTNLERLKWIAHHIGPFQLVFGGKAHPRDQGGKALIRRVFEAAAALKGMVRVVYIENYDLHWGKLVCSGVDLWLNTPQRPQEASGTSGMKAALNGVPSLSVLDGWWIEGHIEGVTGWSIGHGDDVREQATAKLRRSMTSSSSSFCRCSTAAPLLTRR